LFEKDDKVIQCWENVLYYGRMIKIGSTLTGTRICSRTFENHCAVSRLSGTILFRAVMATLIIRSEYRRRTKEGNTYWI
jgi:hypothetical protein